jgi:hypothetical protein
VSKTVGSLDSPNGKDIGAVNWGQALTPFDIGATSVPDLTLDSHSRRSGIPFSRGEKVPAGAEAQKDGADE